MALILHIDASTSNLYLAISKDGNLIDSYWGLEANNHMAMLHPAIDKLLVQNKLHIKNVTAIAILNGPGSYTGLRIALAAGKGLCVALNIPLIACSCLDVLGYLHLSKANNSFYTVFIPRAGEFIYNKYENKIVKEHLQFVPEDNAPQLDKLTQICMPHQANLVMGAISYSWDDYYNSFVLLTYDKLIFNYIENIDTIVPYYIKNTYINK